MLLLFSILYLWLLGSSNAAKVEYNCGTEFKENENSVNIYFSFFNFNLLFILQQIVFGSALKKYEHPWFCDFGNFMGKFESKPLFEICIITPNLWLQIIVAPF